MAEFPRTKPFWVSGSKWSQIKDTRNRLAKEELLFDEYKRFGGALGGRRFIEQGFPTPPTAIT
ncbi:hypothetical protein LCGC14_1146490, partial [marine sediment metagenome]